MVPAHEPRLGIAIEGWKFCLVLIAAALFLGSRDYWPAVVACVAVLVFLLLFFREPTRNITGSPLSVLAPFSGKIVKIEEETCPVNGHESIAITIRLSPFRGYALRAPVEGLVRESRSDGCRRALWLTTDENQDVVARITSGFLFVGRLLRVPYGQRIGHGKRGGVRRLLFGIRVSVPAGSRITCTVGSKVTSGLTEIAKLAANNIKPDA